MATSERFRQTLLCSFSCSSRKLSIDCSVKAMLRSTAQTINGRMHCVCSDTTPGPTLGKSAERALHAPSERTIATAAYRLLDRHQQRLRRLHGREAGQVSAVLDEGA